MEIPLGFCYNEGKYQLPGGQKMELGEKLRQTRLEAGLSQRQLCGEVITRNMLSQIESGKARPSMATLQYLAGQLGKTVSFFLEEEGAVSVNGEKMEQARRAYARKDYGILETYHRPDALLDQEYAYLMALSTLALGKERLEDGNALEAVPLLEQLDRSSIYYREDMERLRRQLLLRSYESLEQYYKEREDYQQAYLYACKSRTISGR